MTCQRRDQGFGLIDALVALSLLGLTLLGAVGSLHFALRATRSAIWQAQAVDLIADLNENLLHTEAALSFATQVESWHGRLQAALPAAQIAAIEARSFATGTQRVGWFDMQLTWNGLRGPARDALRLPLSNAVHTL